MRQISEIITVLKEKEGFSVGNTIECFGPIHSTFSAIKPEEMDQANSSLPIKKDCQESTGQANEALLEAPSVIIKGLDDLLENCVKFGDSLVLTTSKHTTCVFRSRGIPDRWYIFDPLYGSLDCVVSPQVGQNTPLHASRLVHEAIIKPRTSVHDNYNNDRNTLQCTTGLEDNCMYTAVIIKPVDNLILRSVYCQSTIS